ncbi:MAG: hypothetical protein JJD98_12605 [Polaromonas sp.]|nr:hypothetical protein [Polaromonas sp.]
MVGIGASAGGLEALDNFLAHVPAGSGMAFVNITESKKREAQLRQASGKMAGDTA